MGQDWCRMRPLTDDRDLLRNLIEQQAKTIRQILAPEDLNPLNPDWIEHNDKPRYEPALKAYGDVEDQLSALLDVETFRPEVRESDDETTKRVWRVLMRWMDIFPGEWRLESYRSFLPEELPVYLDKWVTYLREVEEGKYRGYLLEWYLYAMSSQMELFWTYLREKVIFSGDKSWSKSIRGTRLPAQILDPNLVPPTYSIPYWADWEKDTRPIDVQADFRYLNLLQLNEHQQKLNEEWNHLAPPDWKNDLAFWTFDDYFGKYNYTYWRDFVAWTRQAIDDGMGFFFWG